MTLSTFHIDTLSFIISGHKDYLVLLAQLPYLQIVDVEYTEVGSFYNYKLNDDCSVNNAELNEPDVMLGAGCELLAAELSYGASLFLLVKDNKVKTLEILAHGGDFPNKELTKYSFRTIPVNIIDET